MQYNGRLEQEDKGGREGNAKAKAYVKEEKSLIHFNFYWIIMAIYF